jgi:hypothetical protein
MTDKPLTPEEAREYAEAYMRARRDAHFADDAKAQEAAMAEAERKLKEARERAGKK